MRLALKTRGQEQTVIELAIEELVLYGFVAGDRYRICEALERELAQLIAKQGIPSNLNQSFNLDAIDGGSFQVKAGAKPEVIGIQLAQSIYSRLSTEFSNL